MSNPDNYHADTQSFSENDFLSFPRKEGIIDKTHSEGSKALKLSHAGFEVLDQLLMKNHPRIKELIIVIEDKPKYLSHNDLTSYCRA